MISGNVILTRFKDVKCSFTPGINRKDIIYKNNISLQGSRGLDGLGSRLFLLQNGLV